MGWVFSWDLWCCACVAGITPSLRNPQEGSFSHFSGGRGGFAEHSQKMVGILDEIRAIVRPLDITSRAGTCST